jgi:dTDP-4-dehydrorhamnose 3,5-epimerase
VDVDGQIDLIDQVILTPLRRVPVATGDVLHGLKASSEGFSGFGEIYFSCVLGGSVKGWKKHTRMTLNLIVLKGKIRFSIFDEVADKFSSYDLSPNSIESYSRLTVPPGLWVAFGGVDKGENMLANIANIEHDPEESITRPVDSIAWNWDDSLQIGSGAK